MATELFVIRHAAVEGENERIFRDNSQPDMDGISREAVYEAITIAESGILNHAGLVYASDLRRARETAEILGSAIRVPIITLPALREVYFGSWSGCAAASLDKTELSKFDDNPDLNMPPGSESLDAVRLRVKKVVKTIEKAKKTVALVSHARFMHVLVTEMLFHSGTLRRVIEFDNCSVSRLIKCDGSWRLSYANFSPGGRNAGAY